MLETLIVLVFVGLIIAGIVLFPHLIKRKRNRLKRLPFPPIWQAILENNLPIYSHLSPDERKRLRGHIQVFLAEKQFIGCSGLEVTEEMKLTIAAVACLLLLNESGRYFSPLRSILVYPSAYRVQTKNSLGNYVVEQSWETRLGEAWARDLVVLSWQQIQQDLNHWNDGHNVILHEFAHQLDFEDGKGQGVPILPNNSDYSLWAEVMTQEYQHLCRQVDRGIKTFIDSYGAKNPAEFFAVVTETFFSRPYQLNQKHPALYRLLQHYYKLDPQRLI
ncbi:protein of unknown function DUF980 [Gloeothece citriformis PCC 7424]|uniref:Zinc-dependent peptidase n=1 Tax=Gloeothece citriformis (strain PCC 7424) TaxID=65393 RepID=B7KKB4_GLOC7|nr:M90 family metallopeptidase [Gloeothece citriformis]ACK72247.1 protein of unknown function DUF980 [Gloeothece citriformis PCC 7424]